MNAQETSGKPVLLFYTNMPTPYQLDLFDALKSCFNLNVVYFTTREADRQWTLETSGNGYSVIVLENNILSRIIQKKVHSFHFSNQIFNIASRIKPDFVIVNGTYWSPNVWIALKTASRHSHKVAFWGEPVFPAQHPVKRKIKRAMLAGVRRYADVLFAIGRKAKESYSFYGYTKPIFNIPYNINSSLFFQSNLSEKKLAELKQQYSANGEIILLSSGSLIARKGMDTLIKAFNQLDSRLNSRLLIIGDGDERAGLESLAAGNTRIHFLGFQQKDMVPYWFNVADIFVFASRYDGWALVINEAMAAGNAIISSDTVGAAYDSLDNEQNALVLDPEDVDGFAKAMDRLITDKTLRERLATNAHHTGETISSLAIAKRIYDIYQLGQ